MNALTGECQEIFVAAVFTLHPGKAVVQIAAIKITINDFPEIRTEESVGSLKLHPVNLDEGFQMILDTAIIVGSLWIVGPVYGSCGGPDSSPPRKTGHLYHSCYKDL